MDYKPYNSILKLIIFLFLGVFALPCLAQANNNIKIAVVDVQEVLDNSVAVVSLRKSIDDISEKLHDEMAAKETNLKTLEAEIAKKKSSLKPELFKKEVNAFYKKVSETQHDMQHKKAKLEQAHAEAISKIHENTLRIVADLAKEKGFNIAVPISQILYTDANLTITKEVIEELNKKVKSVELNYK